MDSGSLCIFTDDWARKWLCVYLRPCVSRSYTTYVGETMELKRSYVHCMRTNEEWVVYNDCLEVINESR